MVVILPTFRGGRSRACSTSSWALIDQQGQYWWYTQTSNWLWVGLGKSTQVETHNMITQPATSGAAFTPPAPVGTLRPRGPNKNQNKYCTLRSSNCTTSTNYLPGARCWIMNSEFLLWSGTYLLPTYFSIRYNLAPYSIYQIVYIITIIVSTRIQELYAIPTLLDIKKKL